MQNLTILPPPFTFLKHLSQLTVILPGLSRRLFLLSMEAAMSRLCVRKALSLSLLCLNTAFNELCIAQGLHVLKMPMLATSFK